MTIHEAPLGKNVQYPSQYDASLLFAIPRAEGRRRLGLQEPLPFSGFDNWTGYEISWLNASSKPQAAIGYFSFAADTPGMIESKSFKLYLNSFNLSCFASQATVQDLMQRDLSAACGGNVNVETAGIGQCQAQRRHLVFQLAGRLRLNHKP